MNKVGTLAIAAALLAAFWLGRSCTPPARAIKSDRVIDLIGLLRDAEVATIPGGDHATLMDARRETTFDEDEVFVPAPAPTRYTFRNVLVPPAARLVHRAGRNRLAAPDDREVTFSATVLQPGLSPQLVFTRRAAPGDFSDAQEFVEESADLAPWAGKTIDLELACEPVQATDTPILWCGFYSPRIESEGRDVSSQDAVTLTPQLAYEFLAHLDEATCTGAGADVARPRVDRVTASPVAGGTRRAIEVVPDQRLEWQLSMAETAELSMGFGVAAADVARAKGEVKLRLLLDERVIFEQTMRPADEPRDRGFKDVRVPIRTGGGSHRLAFECTREPAGGEPIKVGLASPRLLAFERTRAKTAGDDGRNVILILIDTLRADHMSCYGYPRATTPRLEAFAQRALRYERAISPASWTSPATASIFTVRPPHAHGLVDQSRHWLADELKTIAEVFADEGYTTGAFVANPLVSWQSNFDQGFHVYDLAPWVNARGMLALARDWIASVKDRRFFAYIHLIDPHGKYAAPGIYRNRFADDPWHENVPRDEELDPRRRKALDDARRSYDAEIAFADEQIGQFFEALKTLGVFDDAVIAVTSDHGEEFNEHGGTEHGQSLYEELIHVPLLVAGPGVRSGVVSPPLPTLRIGPTLARLAGVKPPAQWLLGSLPVAPDEEFDQTEPCFANTEMPRFNPVAGTQPQVKNAIRDARYKLVLTKMIDQGESEQVEVYDLAQDPGEQHRLPTQSERTTAMTKRLREWRDKTTQLAPGNQSAVDPTEILRAIGYLAAPKKEDGAAEDQHKDGDTQDHRKDGDGK